MDCGPSELESEQYWVREEYESPIVAPIGPIQS